MLSPRLHLGLLLAASLAACDGGPSGSNAEEPTPTAPSQTPGTGAHEAGTGDGETGGDETGAGEAPEPEPPRKVPSGLDVGMTMASFDIIDPEDGSRRCQVCTIGTAPKLVAIGLADDPAFIEDLADLEALLAKYGEQAPQVFAVLAESRDDALLAPADPSALSERGKQLRSKARLTMPVLVVAADDEADTFTEHYRIKQSRTLMLADAENEVLWSQTAPDHLGELDLALSELTGQQHPRPGAPGEPAWMAEGG